MKLSQLAAEAAARLADIRAKDPTADPECFVTFKHYSKFNSGAEERDVESVELFQGSQWYFRIKTEKDEAE